MGYASSLPIDEWRSVELVLDELCRVVLPPINRPMDVAHTFAAEVAGVPGVWYRQRGGASGPPCCTCTAGATSGRRRVCTASSSPGCAG